MAVLVLVLVLVLALGLGEVSCVLFAGCGALVLELGGALGIAVLYMMQERPAAKAAIGSWLVTDERLRASV